MKIILTARTENGKRVLEKLLNDRGDYKVKKVNDFPYTLEFSNKRLQGISMKNQTKVVNNLVSMGIKSFISNKGAKRNDVGVEFYD